MDRNQCFLYFYQNYEPDDRNSTTFHITVLTAVLDIFSPLIKNKQPLLYRKKNGLQMKDDMHLRKNF